MTLLLKCSGTESKIDAIAAAQTAKDKQLSNLTVVRFFLITLVSLELSQTNIYYRTTLPIRLPQRMGGSKHGDLFIV